MYKRFATTTLVAALSMAVLTGCGSSKVFKADPRKPTKLVQIASPVGVLSPVFSAKLEQANSVIKKNKASKKDVVDLQVAPTATGLVAASRGGVVTRFDGGATVWATNLKEAITSGVAIDDAQSVAIVGTRSGQVTAIDVATGEIRWQRTLPSASLTPALVHSGFVLLSANNNVVYALDLATGALAWQYTTQSPTVTVRGAAKPLKLDANLAIIGAADGRVHALEVRSGTPVWVQRVGLASGVGDVARLRDVDDTPTLAGNYLYATSYSGQLAAFDMQSGRDVFTAKLASTKSVAVLDTLLIGGTVDGEVVAIDRFNGNEVWKSEALKFRGLTNAVTVGNYVAIGDREGVIHLFNQAGEIVSRVDAKNQLTSLQVHQNRLYAQSANGVVTAWQF